MNWNLQSRRTRAALLAGLATIALLASPRPGTTDSTPPHLVKAQALVDLILPANNSYGTPTDVRWEGDNGSPAFNRSVCATLVTAILKRTYGYTNTALTAWFGSSSPNAARYHDTIQSQIGFTRIGTVAAAQPGDILAIEYRDDAATSSGHAAMVSSTPVDKGLVSVNGVTLRRYEVWVIDSSQSYHGYSDTRYLRRDATTNDNGVGSGIMRLYADPATDQIAGYTWSNLNGSAFYPQPGEDDASIGRHLVVGRLL